MNSCLSHSASSSCLARIVTTIIINIVSVIIDNNVFIIISDIITTVTLGRLAITVTIISIDAQQLKPKTHISQVDSEGDDDDDNGDDHDKDRDDDEEDHDDDDEADLDKEDGGGLAPSCGYHLLTAPHLQAVSPAVRLLIFFIGFFL